jgi:hypothetical protein
MSRPVLCKNQEFCARISVKQFQLVVAAETAAAFLRTLDQFEDHWTLSI